MIKLSQLINELKLTNDMRIHMSKKPFELEQKTFTQKDELKPTGFEPSLRDELSPCKPDVVTGNATAGPPI